MVNADCEEKRSFMCMSEDLKNYHKSLCPKNFIRYKNECYYHSIEKGDYNKSELLCAEKASRVVTIKDRATFQFIRSWAKGQKIKDFFLGLNYTTGDTSAPVKYSDGSAYDKDVDYAFDDNREKFGAKECTYLKSSIKHKPRDSECSAEKNPVCIWNSK